MRQAGAHMVRALRCRHLRHTQHLSRQCLLARFALVLGRQMLAAALIWPPALRQGRQSDRVRVAATLPLMPICLLSSWAPAPNNSARLTLTQRRALPRPAGLASRQQSNRSPPQMAQLPQKQQLSSGPGQHWQKALAHLQKADSRSGEGLRAAHLGGPQSQSGVCLLSRLRHLGIC